MLALFTLKGLICGFFNKATRQSTIFRAVLSMLGNNQDQDAELNYLSLWKDTHLKKSFVFCFFPFQLSFSILKLNVQSRSNDSKR